MWPTCLADLIPAAYEKEREKLASHPVATHAPSDVGYATDIFRPKRILPRLSWGNSSIALAQAQLSLHGHSHGRSHGRTVSEVGTTRVRPVESKTFVPGTRLGAP